MALTKPTTRTAKLFAYLQDPGMARPQTAAEVLDEAEDEMDAEVAALFARNEHTLKQLREDVKVDLQHFRTQPQK